jgi:hypothetical protein
MVSVPPSARRLRRLAPPAAPQAVVHADAEIARLVAEASGHAAAAFASPFAVGLDVLGDITLPPGAETEVDRTQMRALGALYLAADMEPAGIIASVETLAALAATGAIRVDLGPAAPILHEFWRGRNERIDSAERLAFFGRLFGASYGPAPADGVTNTEFEPLMLEHCEALYRMDERSADPIYGGIAQQTRVRAAARNLLSNLVTAGGGITAFLAAEIMRTLKDALAILTHPHLRGVFMARDIWGVVAAVNRLARVRGGDPRAFVRRGRAGMTIIVWLADAAEALRQYGKPLVRLDHPVIPAAVDWLQSSLTISERQARAAAPTQRPGLSPGGASQWDDLGI